MFLRVTSFFVFQIAGGLLGWWLAGDRGAELGMVTGAAGWFVFDLLRAVRVMRWLRRKLEASGVMIRTVRGLGYLLEAEGTMSSNG